METSPLICRANQWTGFYMVTASVMKDLKVTSAIKHENKHKLLRKPLFMLTEFTFYY